jgi:hypothetical protein
LVRCEVPDPSAFDGVLPQLFDLRQIVLHCMPRFRFPNFSLGTSGVNSNND